MSVDHKTLYSIVDFSPIDQYKTIVESVGYKEQDFVNKESNILNAGSLNNEYKNKNSKFINYLVKEFELRRNAAQYARASVSKTGELDVEKVWSYRLKEDLFKRVTKIPKGKNHAMIMFVDWSGSMINNISNTLEQVLILGDFCRKVAIPFEVYAFSDHNFKLNNGRPNRYNITIGDLYLNHNLYLKHYQLVI